MARSEPTYSTTWWRHRGLVFLVIFGVACSSGSGSSPGTDSTARTVTFLEAQRAFIDCLEGSEASKVSQDDFWEGGLANVTDPADRNIIGSCLEDSEYEQFVSLEGDVTFDQDFISRINDSRRKMQQCMEEKGWPQDPLVFDAEGFLVPESETLTLSDSEVAEYQADATECQESIGSPFQQ